MTRFLCWEGSSVLKLCVLRTCPLFASLFHGCCQNKSNKYGAYLRDTSVVSLDLQKLKWTATILLLPKIIFVYAIVIRQEAHNVIKHLQAMEDGRAQEGHEEKKGTSGFTGITYVSPWIVEKKDSLWAILKETT